MILRWTANKPVSNETTLNIALSIALSLLEGQG